MESVIDCQNMPGSVFRFPALRLATIDQFDLLCLD